MTIAHGLLLGVALAFTLGYGASFWTMVQTSALNGLRRTMPLILGIITGDIIITTVTVGLFINIVEIERIAVMLKNPVPLAIGCIVISAIGVFTMTRKAKPSEHNRPEGRFVSTDTSKKSQMFARGLALDILNPMTWVFWASIVIIVAPMFNDKPRANVYLFFASVIAAQLMCDILKCWLSGQMTKRISAKMMNAINKTVGVLMIGVAVYMFYGFVINQNHAPNDDDKTRTVIERVIPTEVLQGDKARTPEINATWK